MADNVQWIKLKVGMFDGSSFKKIKRAMIGGVSYRDKLTAIWFELLDLAGKSNANGYLIDNNEIPYHTFEDIAIMLDRETEEIELCMQFFLKEKMVEIIDNIYCLSNFEKYQCVEGLEKIREQRRIAQAKWRDRKAQGLIGINVDSTVESTNRLPSNSNSNSNNNINKKEKKIKQIEISPEDFDFTEKVKAMVYTWLGYKKEKGQTYKPTGLKTLLNNLLKWQKEFGEDYVVRAIDNSMQCNYAGIFPARSNNNKKTNFETRNYSKEELYEVYDSLDDVDI